MQNFLRKCAYRPKKFNICGSYLNYEDIYVMLRLNEGSYMKISAKVYVDRTYTGCMCYY